MTPSIRLTTKPTALKLVLAAAALGQEVRRLYAGQTFAAGEHRMVWDGTDDAGRRVASGAYLYELNAGDHSASRRMVMLK